MNDTLKVASRIGAELGAAKAEVARLRGLLRELRDITSEYAWDADLEARVDAALPQQPEPTATYTAVDMATAAAQGFRDGQAALNYEPRTLNEWFLTLEDGRQKVLIEDKWMLANAAFEAGRATRPAQTEQQPEQSQAATDVLTERRRQVEAEGWTPEHDDAYGACELSRAAACYASWAQHSPIWMGQAPEGWPWGRAWWKPGAPRRNLIKAGALILAEIERLDRAALSAQGDEK